MQHIKHPTNSRSSVVRKPTVKPVYGRFNTNYFGAWCRIQFKLAVDWALLHSIPEANVGIHPPWQVMPPPFEKNPSPAISGLLKIGTEQSNLPNKA